MRPKNIREEVMDLKDALDNGIVWNHKTKRFDVVWTKRQLSLARKRANSLCKRLNIK
jgi:hypothetical protein